MAKRVEFHSRTRERPHRRDISFQIAHEKEHENSKWFRVSMEELQRQQVVFTVRSQLCILYLVGHLSRTNNHMRKLCFGISNLFQTIADQGTNGFGLSSRVRFHRRECPAIVRVEISNRCRGWNCTENR